MKEFSFINVLKIIKFNLKKILLIVFVLNSILLAYSLIMPKMYKSEIVIMPPKSNASGGSLSSFISSLAGAGLSIGGVGESKSKLYADILLSKSVTNKVIEDLSLDTLKMFSKLHKIEIQNIVQRLIEVDVEKSGLIVLVCKVKTGYLADDKEIEFTKNLVQKIANAYGTSLDKVLKEKDNSNAKASRIYIESELKRYTAKLDSVSSEFQKFQEENNVLEIEEQTKAIVQSAIDLGSQIIEYENELNLAKLQMNPNSAKVSILEDQVQLMKSQYEKIQNGGLDNDKFSIPLKKVPDLAHKYADLFRERTIIEKVILYLETQRHQESIQEGKNTPVIEILDYAYKPYKKSAPQIMLMQILGLLLFTTFTSLYFVYDAYKKGKLITE